MESGEGITPELMWPHTCCDARGAKLRQKKFAKEFRYILRNSVCSQTCGVCPERKPGPAGAMPPPTGASQPSSGKFALARQRSGSGLPHISQKAPAKPSLPAAKQMPGAGSGGAPSGSSPAGSGRPKRVSTRTSGGSPKSTPRRAAPRSKVPKKLSREPSTSTAAAPSSNEEVLADAPSLPPPPEELGAKPAGRGKARARRPSARAISVGQESPMSPPDVVLAPSWPTLPPAMPSVPPRTSELASLFWGGIRSALAPQATDEQWLAVRRMVVAVC